MSVILLPDKLQHDFRHSMLPWWSRHPQQLEQASFCPETASNPPGVLMTVAALWCWQYEMLSDIT